MTTPRYLKHTHLTGWGLEGQKNISQARVLLVGVGGLGNTIAQYLVAAGLGHLTLLDADHVEESNLSRQILFRSRDLNKKKVLAAEHMLHTINEDCHIDAIDERLNYKNATELLGSHDLVIDATDSLLQKYLINDLCFRYKTPFVFGAASQWQGQCALLLPEHTACYRCLYPAFPKSQIENCDRDGVLGSVVGSIGCLQATLALQYLAGITTSTGTLFRLDFQTPWQFLNFKMIQNQNCTTCSPSVTLRMPAITEGAILDLRSEQDQKQLPTIGAISVRLEDIYNGILPANVSPNQKVYLLCTTRSRAIEAKEHLQSQGFTQLEVLNPEFLLNQSF